MIIRRKKKACARARVCVCVCGRQTRLPVHVSLCRKTGSLPAIVSLIVLGERFALTPNENESGPDEL
jgi:hypothetical protein